MNGRTILLTLTLLAIPQSSRAQFCPPNSLGPLRGPKGCSPVSKGSLNIGDPINIASGHNLYRNEDFTLQTSMGPLPFMRSYVSHDQAWTYSGLVTELVPLPFGAKGSQDIPRWWHNFFALVSAGSTWEVVDRDGRQVEFGSCTPPAGGSCFAPQGSGNAAERDRLERTQTGFAYHIDGGETLVFDAQYKPSSGYSKYLLTRILGRGNAVLATLDYALPSGLSTCRLGSNGATTGLPYLNTVTTVDGTQLVFKYKALQRASSTLVDCVISEIHLRQQGKADELLVAYSYQTDASMVEQPGRLSAAAWSGRAESYDYTGENFQVTRDGKVAVRHNFATVGGAFRAVSSDTKGEALSVEWGGYSSSSSLPPDRLCTAYTPQIRWVTDSAAGRGDGTEGTSPKFRKTYEAVAAYGSYHEPRLYRTIDSCAGAPQSCSPGSVRYEWPCATSALPGYERGIQDKRGNWEVNLYAAAPAGVPNQLIEKQAVLKGATDYNGTNALERTEYGYVYGSQNKQLKSLEKRASLLAPGGTTDHALTRYVYEPATTPAPETDRQKAIIRSGWTRVRDASGWKTEKRYYGTFTFTARVSAGETAKDPYGRVLEEHGPCEVPDENASDCMSADYPLKRYHYWPEDSAVEVRNRLKSVSRYASLTAAPLVTTYAAYDTMGNPTEVVDENGVVTRFTYVNGQISSTQVGSDNATVYGYENGKLSSVQYPAGNLEVYCYKAGGEGDGCGGTPTDQLQWKAKASTSDGASWTEKVVYSYWPDGTQKEVRYQTWTGSGAETRRVEKYAADAHRRPTWQGWGEGAGSFTAAKSFDGADNLTGIGNAFNAPPAWCDVNPATGSPQSQLCAALAYDRANRLASLTEYPSAAIAGHATLFNYDSHGNIVGVKSGCAAGDTYSACTQPAITYVYDDFDRVVEVALPHANGPVRYAYDARDNQLVKETEAMRQAHEYVSYSYDMLSRLLSAQRVYDTGTELLYRYGYDSQGTYPSGCPALTYTMGRARYREDSFGQTWYQYDSEGHVLGEIRVRAGQTTCGTVANANPHTYYTYTTNGNLASVTYPNGRTVTYVYGSGANMDRVAAVDVTLHDGSVWTTKRLLSNVTWEPYGELRGYTLAHPSTGTTSTVEYGLGDNGSVAPTGCSMAFPSTASSDLAGRLRSLRVSSGAMAMGTGAGDIYQRTYTWKADQVVRTDTCLLGASAPRTETYSYDRTLRLTGMQWSADSITGSYGVDYDGRGNRMSMNIDGSAYNMSYAAAPQEDRLTGWSSSEQNSLWGYSLAYDADGRVIRKEGARTLDGQPTYTLGFVYGQSVGVATETVFRAVAVNGVFYNYYYDAQGRRRLKSYPGGASDEYFHDMSSLLLVDRGSSSTTTPVAHYTQDDYVWLGRRPVAMVRGKLSNMWTRLADTSTNCARNGEAAACGVYFPVTDHIGTAVLMLDGKGQVAGVADYEPFGHVNRVALRAETEHPLYAWLGDNDVELVELRQPTTASTSVRMRVLFHLLDTQGVGHVDVKDSNTGVYLLTGLEESAKGSFWSGWVQPSAGRAWVELSYDACHTDCSGIACREICGHEHAGTSFAKTLAPQPNPPHGTITNAMGVVVEGYEYQRYQTGAQPFWTPLRFPGQYHDAETDLLENWNRYYDPSIGRYLQPEPMLQKPGWVKGLASSGYSPPTYAYAANNPVNRVDTDGNDAYIIRNPQQGLIEHWGVAIDLSCHDEQTCDPTRIVQRYDFSCSKLGTATWQCVFGAPKGRFSSYSGPLSEMLTPANAVEVIPLDCNDTFAAVERACGELRAIPRYSLLFNHCQDFVRRVVGK